MITQPDLVQFRSMIGWKDIDSIWFVIKDREYVRQLQIQVSKDHREVKSFTFADEQMQNLIHHPAEAPWIAPLVTTFDVLKIADMDTMLNGVCNPFTFYPTKKSDGFPKAEFTLMLNTDSKTYSYVLTEESKYSIAARQANLRLDIDQIPAMSVFAKEPTEFLEFNCNDHTLVAPVTPPSINH